MYRISDLKSFCAAVFEKMGHSPKDSSLAADVLVSADVRGVDSHGVARLSGYVRLWRGGRINTKASISIVHESPSTAVVDADAALGLLSAPKAMEIAIEKAQKVGTGWVSVKNSNHFGIAGYHAMMALKHDMIGMAMTNASPLVSPTFSKDRMLGTNPIAVAIPANRETPFVGDMATTTAANGKLEILQRKGDPTPNGWVQDLEGNPVTDPYAVKNGGALLPLGGDKDHGSHKGYILGSMVDIFSAVLSGANYGPWVPPFVSFLKPSDDPVGEGLGHFFGVMRVDAFRPKEEFLNHMDNWLKTFRAAQTIPGQERVLIPGDLEREMEKERLENGVPLMDKVVDDLTELGESLGIEFMKR